MLPRCKICGALCLGGKWELHQKMCDFHFLKWARDKGLTKNPWIDDEVIDNFSIGGEFERKKKHAF
jgi:hypothetical protein